MSVFSIALAGTFTVESLRAPLERCLSVLGIESAVSCVPYGQLLTHLVDIHSSLHRQGKGFNVLLFRPSDFIRDSLPPSQLQGAIDTFCHNFENASRQWRVPTLVILAPPQSQLASSVSETEWQNIEASLRERFQSCFGVEVTAAESIFDSYQCPDPLDVYGETTAHIPWNDSAWLAIATAITRYIDRHQRSPLKAVIVDCDNTLWQGACAEDGPSGIKVETRHANLQRLLLKQRQQGRLICLCSKNSPEDVWSVFQTNPDMVLSREQITASMINWLPKSANILQLAQKLGLSPESFIFLDDNPLEIGEVRAHLPEVISIHLPNDPMVSWEKRLEHLWPLDKHHQTTEDAQRVQMYAEEARRESLRTASQSLPEFLMSLEIEVDIQPLNSEDRLRADQLLQRTNQFNVRPSLRSLSQLEANSSEHKPEIFTVRCRDRFGDYGLVGLMLFHRQASGLYIDQFVLSCRALGRTVEVRMLQHLAQIAQACSIQKIKLDFEASQRNQPAYNFVCQMASKAPEPLAISSVFEFDIDETLALNPYSFAAKQPAREKSTVGLADNSVEKRELYSLYQKISELHTVDLIADFHRTRFSREHHREDSVEIPQTNLERQICAICQDVLYYDAIGMSDSFRDLGCTSLQLVQLCSKIHATIGISIPVAETFALATVRDLVQLVQNHLSSDSTKEGSTLPATAEKRLAVGSGSSSRKQQFASSDGTVVIHPEDYASECEMWRDKERGYHGQEIAIIGLAGRFPGADDIHTFWRNLVDGVESIETLSDTELNLPFSSPLRKNANLVKRAAYIKDAERFDARFFGVFPKEAAAMDPQHRLLLEECYHALEDAGYIPDQIEESVGVFAGCYMDTYVLSCLESHPQWIQGLANSFHGGDLLTELGNDKDYLATRIAFLLNLRGPALTIQTACSTSLVAIIQACQSLLSNQCKLALAGGVTLKFPQKRGYLYTDEGMVSPEGKCRTFDARARGTIFGEGVAVVVLKRLQHALQDGDPIYAVLKGWGINNDGRSKAGYTAPSISGQMEAITLAHRHANINANTIQYIEAHGTGTSLGDPIEVEALTRAFRQTTADRQFCRIGSVKTNIGHLDVAAGACGLIKTSLALRYEQIPASLNFETPNPNIDFASSPFVVNTECTSWPRGEQPRRAGLSSFGVGGTNAHVIVEESPALQVIETVRPHHVLTLSARSEAALVRIKEQYLEWFKSNTDSSIADICFTLSIGRKKFNHTWTTVVSNVQQAIEQLDNPDQKVSYVHSNRRNVPLVFAFPGQGSQYLDMGYDLYCNERAFTDAFDQCDHLLEPYLGFHLREALFSKARTLSDSSFPDIQQTIIAQPGIFAISYATAHWLQSLGLKPTAMIGHSVGEFVAACLSGVFSLEDALRIVAFRAQLMQQLAPGHMLAVRLGEDAWLDSKAYKKYTSRVSLAAVNSPQLIVLSGEIEVVENLQQELELEGVVSRILKTSHAFHSWMMDSVVEPLAGELRKIKLQRPVNKIISSVSGQWLSDEEATSPEYWARHLRETVHFSKATKALLEGDLPTIVEVGPGQTLATLIRQHHGAGSKSIIPIFPHHQQDVSLHKHALEALGKIWQTGTEVQLANLYASEKRQRLNLPGYPFERQRFWFDQLVQPNASLPTSTSQEPVDLGSPGLPSESVQSTQQARGLQGGSRTGDDFSNNAPNDEYSGFVQQVIRQQLELMAQQLKLWQLR